jgi:hypothetical protein
MTRMKPVLLGSLLFRIKFFRQSRATRRFRKWVARVAGSSWLCTTLSQGVGDAVLLG